MTAVKICGITDAAAYEAAADADYVGFVFFPASPRALSAAQAAALPSVPGPRRVGLFVDPADAQLEAVLGTVALDILQLVAPPDRVAAIRRRFGRPVWRAIGVRSAADLPEDMEGADLLLLDARAPADATRPGGNARAFDWSVLRDWTPPGPWGLAGGLTPRTVAEAVRQTGAELVDVSSGVETSLGVKDPALIEAFVRAAKGIPLSSPRFG